MVDTGEIFDAIEIGNVGRRGHQLGQPAFDDDDGQRRVVRQLRGGEQTGHAAAHNANRGAKPGRRCGVAAKNPGRHRAFIGVTSLAASWSPPFAAGPERPSAAHCTSFVRLATRLVCTTTAPFGLLASERCTEPP